MIYIAVCDDNEKTAETLGDKVEKYLKSKDIPSDLTVYTKSSLLKYDIQEGKQYDLVLSDIEMPDMDGMRLAKYLKMYLPEVLIIFITSYLKYAVDAYELSVFRYIPKNELAFRLPHALNDAVNMIQMQAEDFYVIDMPSRIERIPCKKILYLQREGKNTVFYMLDGSETRVRKSLSQVFEELRSEDFIYVNRGDIINLAHVMGLKDGIVELKNGIRLPVSQAKIMELKNKLSRFWMARL